MNIKKDGIEAFIVFPNRYDDKFAKRLSPGELAEYYAHLRTKGYIISEPKIIKQPKS